MTTELNTLVMRIFKVTAKYDDCDLWWRTDGEYAPRDNARELQRPVLFGV